MKKGTIKLLFCQYQERKADIQFFEKMGGGNRTYTQQYLINQNITLVMATPIS